MEIVGHFSYVKEAFMETSKKTQEIAGPRDGVFLKVKLLSPLKSGKTEKIIRGWGFSLLSLTYALVRFSLRNSLKNKSRRNVPFALTSEENKPRGRTNP